MFTRRGTSSGERRIFSLFSYGRNYFYISVIPEGQEPGTRLDIDLYSVPASELELLPSLSGWSLVAGGVAPAPNLRLKYA